MQRRNVFKLINLLLIGLVVLLPLKCFVGDPLLRKVKEEKEKKQAAAQQAEKQQPAIPIKVFKAGRFDFEDSLMALGTIKGMQEFKLSFEVPGIVEKIFYKEGAAVEKGAPIISLKKEDIQLRVDRSQSQLNKAKADFNLAQRHYEDSQKLFEIGAIPRSTLEKARLELDKAKYDQEVAQVEFRASESVMEKSTLSAGETGIIGDLNVEEGEAVTPNTLIGSLIVISKVKAKFGVLEKDLSKIAAGQKASVMVDAYPDRVFSGEVENVSRQIAGQSRTSDAWVSIENPEKTLLPGMFARIKVSVYKAQNVIVIPTESIRRDEKGTYVFVVDLEKNEASRREVKVAYSRSDYTHVESGVNEGEWVATSGFEDLKDQARVEVLEKQEKVF